MMIEECFKVFERKTILVSCSCKVYKHVLILLGLLEMYQMNTMLKIKKQGDETYVTDPNSESEIDSNKRTNPFIETKQSRIYQSYK